MNRIRIFIAEWLLLLILYVVPKGTAQASDFFTFSMMYTNKWKAYWDEKIREVHG